MTISNRSASLFAIILALLPLGACAARPNNVLLIPLDDRPATGKYTQSIGAIGGWHVQLPVRRSLGQYKDAGNTDEINTWLKSSELIAPRVALISIDMIAYGGLISSRNNKVSLDDARKRLEIITEFHRAHPGADIVAFTNSMGLAQNFVPETRTWRIKLARWAELKPAANQGDAAATEEIGNLEKDIDPKVIADFVARRDRNLKINLAAIDLVKSGVIDQLVVTEEDLLARGLNRDEEETLKKKVEELKISDRVQFVRTGDETSSLLVSRLAVTQSKAPVRLSVIYSSDKARNAMPWAAPNTVEKRLQDRIALSGASVVPEGEPADYLLYVNGPETSEAEFAAFSERLLADLKANKRVALADARFGVYPFGSDKRFRVLLDKDKLFDHLLAYAAYDSGTAAIGTTIAAANMSIVASRTKQTLEDAARGEVARLTFLFQRYVEDDFYLNDFLPEIDKTTAAGAEQLDFEAYQRVRFQGDVAVHKAAPPFFDSYFKGRIHPVPGYPNNSITLNSLQTAKFFVPWFRAWEPGTEFSFDYTIK